MTQTPAETGLSAAAEARLDDYLRQVRAAVAGAPDVNPGEIEADIREHVENELRAAARPVPPFVLEAVLARLGPPTQWLPAGQSARPAELPSLGRYFRDRVRSAFGALWRGPEDWRLPYLAFGVFALGVLTVVVFPLFLLVSYVLARAGIALAREKGIEPGAARKWLLYPPMVVVSLALVGGLATVPVVATALVTGDARATDREARMEWKTVEEKVSRQVGGVYVTNTVKKRVWVSNPDVVTDLDRVYDHLPGKRGTQDVLFVVAVGAGVFGVWGAVCGLLAGRYPGAVRAVFAPLFDGFDGTFARRAGLACVLAVAVWCGFAYRVATDAGLL